MRRVEEIGPRRDKVGRITDLQHRNIESAINLLRFPRPAPIADDKIRAEREHFFKRATRLTHVARATAEIRIVALRANRESGDLRAVSEREHELIGAIIEADDAAWFCVRA